MDKQRWRQVETLSHAALAREPPARGVFLDEACAGDEELRRDVEELLGFDCAAKSFYSGESRRVERKRSLN